MRRDLPCSACTCFELHILTHCFLTHCAGGQPYSIVSILDTMDVIKPDIATIAMGQCASTATLLLVSSAWPYSLAGSVACSGFACCVLPVLQAAGTKGKRFAMPNARIMMHQPAGSVAYTLLMQTALGCPACERKHNPSAASRWRHGLC